MNRTGLYIALTVGAVVGVLFGIHPQYDIDFSRLFFDGNSKAFTIGGQPWEQHARDAARALVSLIAAPFIIAICGKLLLPRRRMLIRGRVAMFIALTLAIGPGLFANSLLKDHWGRMRPFDITEFGGNYRFTPWWDPRGPCPNNCSFIAGEPSGAFWTVAPAALAPAQWRLLAYGAAISFGAAVGLMRIAAGGHFFTDVAFAGVFIYLIVWLIHGWMFRWRATRLAENAIERGLASPRETLCSAFSALARRLGRRTGKRKESID